MADVANGNGSGCSSSSSSSNGYVTAISKDSTRVRHSGFQNGNSHPNGLDASHTNGHSGYLNGAPSPRCSSADGDNDVYDLICIGFGPASLAIAIALHDQGTTARVLFLERQPGFAWHAGMLLPGSRMQISFIKDLATLRDPRSKFTFLNYLHVKKRLATFTNLGTFLPLREEYNDYMSWCASHFKDSVRYGQDVTLIAPIGETLVKRWEVTSKDIKHGGEKRLIARHVVVAVGGRPNIPNVLRQNPLNSRIIHSSGYSSAVPKLLNERSEAYRIAVVGAGQSAAEIFNDLHTRYPNSETTLIIKGSALRPSDDSPFVNEIFDPSHVDSIFSMPKELRRESIIQDSATNYGVVRLELIERLYETLYHQRLQNPNKAEWQHRVVTLREVAGAEEGKTGTLYLKLRNTHTSAVETSGPFDAVIFATGYIRNLHETLLKPARRLLEGERIEVNRDYRVKFREGAVEQNSGVWLQGCCESTHGLSDTLLSVLAVRGGEMVDSIFGKEPQATNMTGELVHNCKDTAVEGVASGPK